ncbi:hypothetical protein [Amycolatopsis pittospori]
MPRHRVFLRWPAGDRRSRTGRRVSRRRDTGAGARRDR